MENFASQSGGSLEDGLGIDRKGLSVFSAAVFIAGEMAGSGILALPKAIANTGWFGIGLIFFIGWASIKACLCLSDSWLMIGKKWPEYRGHVRNPYPTIAERSCGLGMKRLSSIMMDIQLFGASLVFLLLCSELIAMLIGSYTSLTHCDLIFIIGAILCPLSWLGSPADFTPVAFGAILSTLISCLIIMGVLTMESGSKFGYAEHSPPSFKSFLLGLSTIVFAYGGTVTLPSFQNDMIKKEQFPRAVFLGFAMMIGIYLPIAFGSYIIIGDSVDDDVLKSLGSSPWTTVVKILMAFHVFCAYLIVVNPLNQDLEQQVGVIHSFNVKRTAIRTSVSFLLIFTGLSVPQFGKILNLVGAATVIPQTFIFPPWFYIKLVEITEEEKVSFLNKIQLLMIALLGVAATIIATYFSIMDLFSSGNFVKPCYT